METFIYGMATGAIIALTLVFIFRKKTANNPAINPDLFEPGPEKRHNEKEV